MRKSIIAGFMCLIIAGSWNPICYHRDVVMLSPPSLGIWKIVAAEIKYQKWNLHLEKYIIKDSHCRYKNIS